MMFDAINSGKSIVANSCRNQSWHRDKQALKIKKAAFSHINVFSPKETPRYRALRQCRIPLNALRERAHGQMTLGLKDVPSQDDDDDGDDDDDDESDGGLQEGLRWSSSTGGRKEEQSNVK